MLVTGVSLAAFLVLPGLPAFAQSYNAGRGNSNAPSPYSAYGAVTPFGSPTLDQNAASHLSAGRAAAIRACNAGAAKYSEYLWGDMEFQQYRSCMAQHGQPE
jgi:hypothetical protein